jgi:hypothetical protein
MHHGYRIPGNGAIVAAVCNGLTKPDGTGLICEKILTGKPNKQVIDLIRG